MEFTISKDEFLNGKMFNSNGKLVHSVGNRFKLFPFVTQNNSAPVDELSNLVGTFLCKIEDQKPVGLSASELADAIGEVTIIEQGDEKYFVDMIRALFFEDDGRLRPLNLKMLAHTSHKEVSEEKVADYLVDVLGEKCNLENIINASTNREAATLNVLERLAIKNLQYETVSTDGELPYYRVVNSLKNVFENDFEYILQSQMRIREYLIPLLELYFFSYTAQSCLQLDRFMQGERDENIPVYFCLDWEKTSQSRRCFTEGWQMLQASIEKMFAHAVTLEILNHTTPSSGKADYIGLNDVLMDSPNLEMSLIAGINELTAIYRAAIPEKNAVKEHFNDEKGSDSLASSIKELFDTVKYQFENSGRKKPYDTYAGKFESFCKKFLKSRGRSGYMLSLSEDELIFLTKISIKDRERLRLKEVFDEFEKRGVFLDDISKDQIANYYERLNLIEKKSDSGDAKYVKRIL